jgi:hypothetical protein
MQESSEKILETSLMVFSALAKPISKRKDLISLFEQTLNRNLEYILG